MSAGLKFGAGSSWVSTPGSTSDATDAKNVRCAISIVRVGNPDRHLRE